MDFLKDNEAALWRLDDIISAATDAEDMDYEVEAASEYNEKILYAVSRASSGYKNVEGNQSAAQATGFGPNNHELLHLSEAAGLVRAHHPLAVQLPELQIPTFHGSFRGWQSFWDHFDCYHAQ